LAPALIVRCTVPSALRKAIRLNLARHVLGDEHRIELGRRSVISA
jgi:hypothetical protein